LAFNGRIHHLEKGYWLKFEIGRVKPTPERPHGLSYSFTLHDPNGKRLVGFDNAHGVQPPGSVYRKANIERDHWHRTGDDLRSHLPPDGLALKLLDAWKKDDSQAQARMLARCTTSTERNSSDDQTPHHQD
jgi:hypothetical protein